MAISRSKAKTRKAKRRAPNTEICGLCAIEVEHGTLDGNEWCEECRRPDLNMIRLSQGLEPTATQRVTAQDLSNSFSPKHLQWLWEAICDYRRKRLEDAHCECDHLTVLELSLIHI